MTRQEFDPITLQVISGALDTIAEEMGHILYRMLFSSIIRESQDLGAGLFDTDFNTLCESESAPLHIGSLPGIPETLQSGKWNDGDCELRDDVMPGAGRFRGGLGVVKKQRILTDGFITHECDCHELARRRLELRRPPPPPQRRRRNRGHGGTSVEWHSRTAHRHLERQQDSAGRSAYRDRVGGRARKRCWVRGAGFPFRQSSRNMPTGVAHDPRDSLFGVHPFEICLGNTGHDVCKGPCKSPTGPTWRPTRSS